MFITSALGTTLPNGYTELEYLESTGTQYIDTNYIFPSTGDVEINGQFMYVGQQVEKSIFGCQRYGDTISPLFWIKANGKLYFYVGKSLNVVDNIPFNYDTVNTFHIKTTGSNYELQFNNNLYSGTFTQGWPSQWSFALFGNHYDNPWQGQAQDDPIFTQLSTTRLYSFEMKVDGNIVMDFVPAKRDSDGVLGMYDMVSGTFFINSGTGSFVAGPAVSDEPSCEYTQLEYIESTGTQYIDTDFVYDNNTRVVWDIQLTATIPLVEQNNSGVGYAHDNNYARFGFVWHDNNWNQKLYFYKARTASDNNTMLPTIDNDNSRHTFELDSTTNKVYVDGTEYTFDPAVGDIDNSDNLTLPLLAWLGYNTSTNQYEYSHFAKAKLYGCKIWDNGTLARNMIPAKRNSDNVVGMYDTVNGVFYTNSGTGSFIAGPAVAQPATISIHWGDLSEPDASGMCVYGETFTAPSTAPTAPSGLKFLGWRPM